MTLVMDLPGISAIKVTPSSKFGDIGFRKQAKKNNIKNNDSTRLTAQKHLLNFNLSPMSWDSFNF